MSSRRVDPARAEGGEKSSEAAGFTLLETLVVLVIVAMVAALLFEGLGRLNDMRGRLGPFLAASERQQLMNFWFRQSVNGAWPDKKDGAHLFAGDAGAFSGLTLAPLNEDAGRPMEFKWQLVYDSLRDQTALVYTGFGGRKVEVGRWQGSKIGFSYLAPDLTWHDTWPPGLRQAAQLPVAVRLFGRDDGMVIVAAVKGAADALPDAREIFPAR